MIVRAQTAGIPQKKCLIIFTILHLVFKEHYSEICFFIILTVFIESMGKDITLKCFFGPDEIHF